MRLSNSNIMRALITLVIGGCNTGSLLTGISGNGGGGGGNTPPVLSFFVQPNTANVGQAISPPVEVLARDSLGNPDSAFTGSITVSLASNSTGASLSGTTAVRPVNGIASFGSLAVNQAGTYTLQASTTDAVTVTSAAFTITTR
ncbi:MAG TPA: hypothetical protein VEK83_00365 [Gemmatimonadales bacterium]|nr:hypothetical protein [Gemmatimonadales bacterium]